MCEQTSKEYNNWNHNVWSHRLYRHLYFRRATGVELGIRNGDCWVSILWIYLAVYGEETIREKQENNKANGGEPK